MSDNLAQALVLLVVGMGVVFLVLILLAGLLFALKALDEWLNRRRIQQYAAQVEQQPESEDLNDQVVAVLAAAASATLKRKVIIRGLRLSNDRGGSSWSLAGRSSVMGSHSIQRRHK